MALFATPFLLAACLQEALRDADGPAIPASTPRPQEDRNIADMFAFALWQTGDPDFQSH